MTTASALPAKRLRYRDAQDWLLRRRHGIGGSDAAAILGLHPYVTPLAVWLDKTSTAPPEDRPPSLAADLGHRVEPILRDLLADALHGPVRPNRYLWQSRRAPHAQATPDGFVDDDQGLVECKLIHRHLWEPYRDGGLPVHWVAQAQHYLAVLGASRVHFSVLVGLDEWVHRVVEPDPDWAEQWLGYIERWWDTHIQHATPPPPDGADGTAQALRARWTVVRSETAAIPEHLLPALRRWADADRRVRAAERDRQAAAAEIQLWLADRAEAAGFGWRVTWKPTTRRTVDWARIPADLIPAGALRETTTRTFRIYPPKESKEEA